MELNIKFQEWKKKHVDDPSKSNIIKLSDDEQYALNNYISSNSYVLNEKLRNEGKLSKLEVK